MIQFTHKDWQRIKETYQAFWARQLKRPIIHLVLHDADPQRTPSELPFKHVTASYGKDVSTEKIVDAWDFELSSKRFLGDAFPSVWPNFGPGIVAGFCGADVQVHEKTVWFHPKETLELNDINPVFDPDNYWTARLKSIYKSAISRWQGNVQLGMTDLGGVVDILAVFRPNEELLMDVLIAPDDVKSAIDRIDVQWWNAFEYLDQELKGVNPGYTAWAPIFSSTPYYILQADFTAMIGPESYQDIIKENINSACKRLGNSFYHLDGPTALPHLDHLLSIDHLDGIQWVPGDGQPPVKEWKEVVHKISDSGKLLYLSGDFDTLDIVASELGTAENIVFFTEASVKDIDKARAFCKKYGAPQGL